MSKPQAPTDVGGYTALATTSKVSVGDKLVRFTRPDLTEEYSVSVDGVRQDFIIESPPLNSQPSTLNHSAGDLRVELALSGARAEAAACGARLTLEGSRRALAYSRLRVTDATGRELTARLAVLATDRLAVCVADANATYPVRIDPTFSDADWISLGSGMNGEVQALAVNGTDLYAGGHFTTAGGVQVNRIAKWHGNSWSALGSGMNGDVYALAVSGTNLYAGGYFTTAGGVTANNIAKWDGSAWSALGSGMSGGFGDVLALLVSGNDLYAGGSFTRAGGVAAANIAKWNGSAWSALGSGMNSDVHALAVSGTDLYAGGYFTGCIAKWDGNSWRALGSGITGGGSWSPGVEALALIGNDLYAGGWFNTAGGVAVGSIAKWNGSAWSALGSGVGGGDAPRVFALAVIGTNLYAGGVFTMAGGVPANSIAKWNGSAWSALGLGMNDSVGMLAPDGTGQLFAGGYFSSQYIAEAILNPSAPTILTPPQAQTIQAGATLILTVDATGGPWPAYQWVFNGTTAIEGATTSVLSLANVQSSQAGTYTVVVTNAAGSVTSSPAIVSVVNVRPAIVTQPKSQAFWAGFTVDIPAEASGTVPLAYQWVFNGTSLLIGATNSTLQLTNVQPWQAGRYTVIVTNAYGAVTSLPALLSLVPSNTVPTTSEAVLRAAIAAGSSPVTFACDGTITLAGSITTALDTVLDASGHQITISGSNACRVFFVNSNVNLTLINLTIANGLSTNGYGGGIYNEGTLNAMNCHFVANTVQGAPGADYGIPCFPGQDGSGGAVYNSGALNISGCVFGGNSASGGRGGVGGTYPWGATYVGGGGGAGNGGAICNLGLLAVRGSTFSNNSALGGPGGGGGSAPMYAVPAANGANGGAGGAGNGSALFNGGSASVVNCTFALNWGVGALGGYGGGGSDGWDKGVGGNGGVGGSAFGTIFGNGQLHVTNCTLAFNSGAGGSGGPGVANGGSGTVFGCLMTGGGQLVNTLLASNLPANCYGTITDAGHNLSSDGSCVFTGIGSMNNADPKLGPLADNGGPTLSMALLPGSPAIDAGNTVLAPATDQRGFPRPAGLAADIGAFEYGSVMPTIAISRSGATGLNILASGNANQPCRLLSSTDLLSWVPVATNQIRNDGTVLFYEPYAPGGVCRFYRLVMP